MGRFFVGGVGQIRRKNEAKTRSQNDKKSKYENRQNRDVKKSNNLGLNSFRVEEK